MARVSGRVCRADRRAYREVRGVVVVVATFGVPPGRWLVYRVARLVHQRGGARAIRPKCIRSSVNFPDKYPAAVLESRGSLK